MHEYSHRSLKSHATNSFWCITWIVDRSRLRTQNFVSEPLWGAKILEKLCESADVQVQIFLIRFFISRTEFLTHCSMYCLYLVAPCKVKRKLTSGRLYSGTFRKRPLKMSSLGGKICEPAGSPRSRGEHYCVKCSWEVCILPRTFHHSCLLNIWGTNRANYGQVENREWEELIQSLVLRTANDQDKNKGVVVLWKSKSREHFDLILTGRLCSHQ